MTLAERLTRARTDLVAAGVSASDAAVDVDVYAREILGWDRARLLIEMRGPVPMAFEPRFTEWVERRKQHEPTAYIIGEREFWNLSFRVTPAVLIPRPETELIVEEALELLKGLSSPRVADIGTGSGCLAVSIAHEVSDCHIVATDVSAEALDVARSNADRHGVAERITFVRTAYLDQVSGVFDLVVSNPPYVSPADRTSLRGDVLHEPEVALFGGTDGLRDIAGALDGGMSALRPGGWLVMEFGAGQEEAVTALVAQRAELKLIRIRRDFQGIPRTIVLKSELSRAAERRDS